MYPLVGEVELHAVDVGNGYVLLLAIHLLHLHEDGIHVGGGSQVDTVLGDEIVGEAGTKLAHLAALVCQTAQEEGDAYEGITAIMALGIDDSAIALAADNGMYILHLGGHVYLAYCGCGILAAMLLCHVAEGTGRGKVAYGVARCLAEHIVGYAYQGILLTKHFSIFANERQAVYVRVYYDTHVVATLLQLVHDAAQVLLQRLGIMCEVAVGLAVEEGVLHAECVEQLREDDTAYRVDRVHANLEVGILDSLNVHEFQGKHRVDVALVECVVFCIFAQSIYVSILEVLLLGDGKYLVAVGGSKELPLVVEELEGIPLARVVGSGDDDTASRTAHGHGKFGGRSGGKADVEHIIPHAHQGATHHVLHHLAGDARIAAYDDGIALGSPATTDEGSVGRCKLHDVERIQCIARRAADSTADAGNGLNQCHID